MTLFTAGFIVGALFLALALAGLVILAMKWAFK